MTEYHRLMADRAKPQQPIKSAGVYVVDVLDDHLSWCEHNKAKGTYLWYNRYLESFDAWLATNHGEMLCDNLKPLHVEAWVNSHPAWRTGRRGASKKDAGNTQQDG